MRSHTAARPFHRQALAVIAVIAAVTLGLLAAGCGGARR